MTVNIVFVHGYQDCGATWAEVSDRMSSSDITSIAVNLGKQEEEADSASLLEGYASQVVAACASLRDEDPIILVGHSMGGAIAELAAEQLGDRVIGVALITPAPLQGVPLPPEVMERFMSRLGTKDVEVIRQGRLSMARSLSEQGLEALVNAGLSTPWDVGAQQLRAWTGGHPKGKRPSAVRCPVLMIATDDTFFTVEVLRQEARRFPFSRLAVIEGAGHWAHVEKPDDISRTLCEFAESLLD